MAAAPARLAIPVSARRSYTLPVLGEWALLLLVLSGLLLLIQVFAPFKRIEASLFDAAQSFWQHPPPEDIVLVAIDEDSLAGLGRWPWRRAIHAALLDRLRLARAVGFDIILAEADERDPAGDASLARAIATHGRVVLPVSVEARAGALTVLGPGEPFAGTAAALGHIHLELDEDGIARRIFLEEGLGTVLFRHFAAALLDLARNAKNPPPGGAGNADGAWIRRQAWLIPFLGKPGHFRQVPYLGVLRGDYPEAFFADKIVLIGATATGLGDSYPTPVSGRASAMPGIEILANILEGLRRGVNLKEIAPAKATWIYFTLLCAVMLAYLWLTPRHALFLTLGGVAAVVSASALLLRHAHLWIAPVSPVVLLMLAYPLWSWRRLEATRRYMDEELKCFMAEPELLPVPAPQRAAARFVPDVIARRIEAVREATARLRRMRRLVADMLDNLPEAALLIDRRGRIVLANARAAQYCGAPARADMHGTPLHDWLSRLEGASPSPLETLVQEVLAGREPTPAEFSSRDGRQFMVGLAPCESEAAGISGAIVSLADITRLREEERRRRELMRFLSHDIRAPQAAILTLLDSASEDGGSRDQTDMIRRIRRYASRALELSDNLFRFLQAERLDPEQFCELDLGAVLTEVLDEYWHRARTQDIALSWDLPDEPLPISGNRALLARAFGNLLDNAIKYSPARTRIHLVARSEGTVCRITLSDQGYGFPADRLPLAFGLHRRFHTESHPHIPGTGLGLAFAKLVVEKHGGRIRLDSQTGEGTTVEVVLPGKI